jgi:nitronate monooxygenase
VPVLAAGGISNARGLAAVLAAGAAGAWVGTAFLACPEGDQPPAYRDAVVAAGEADTLYSRVFDIGRDIPWPARFGGRALRTEFADRWHGREAELEASDERFRAPVFWAGEGVAQLATGGSAAEVVASFAAAVDLLARVCSGATDG